MTRYFFRPLMCVLLLRVYIMVHTLHKHTGSRKCKWYVPFQRPTNTEYTGAVEVLLDLERKRQAKMFRIPLSLPTLGGIILNVILFKSEASSGGLTCTSPCQQADASGASGIPLPPCVISTTRSCETDVTVPVKQAPGPPLQVGLDSSSYIATDGNIYLDLAPRWKAPTDRISLLTGYEVKVKCHHNICAAQYFCVTISFNRTLTFNDAQSDFSVTCQDGDFAQPDMDYITIIHSLPNNVDNSNEGRFLTKLPSCGQESNLTVCNIESPENWIPTWRPKATQIPDGSVEVIFWPSNKYTVYDVMLEEVGATNNYHHLTVTVTENHDPVVVFDNVTEGTYRAYVWINEALCAECPMIPSNNNINVKSMPPTPPIPPITPKAPAPTSQPTPSLPLAVIAGALGGVLLVVLILFFVFRICKWSPGPPSMFRETNVEGDTTESAMSHHNNIPYNDCDSLNGTQNINHFLLLNGTTIYSDDPTSRFTSPSMVPATIHHDNMSNGRLMQESQFYANSMPYKQMDSISKVVDIHSPMDIQTSSRCEQPSSPDSGLDSIHSDGTMEDDKTLVSLALTSLGDEV